MAKLDNGFQELLGVFREMVDYIRKDKTGRPKKNIVLAKAKSALERAEVEMDWLKRRQASQASPYFGQLGYRYDFQLKILEAHKRDYGYRLVCVDGQGRTYVLKVAKDDFEFDVYPGLALFLRGKIADRKIVNKRHMTYLEVMSGIQKVSPSEGL